MTTNPYTAQVADLIARIAQLEQQARDLRNSEASWFARYQDWGANTPQGQESLQQARSLSSQAAGIDTQVAALKSQLATAQKAEADFNAAFTSAIAQGLSPEAAAIEAQSQADRRALLNKALRIGLIIAGVVAVFGAVWLIKRLRKG
ncbi:MAG: hypothetical protein QY325_04385 [Flavobacteriales bacterium]|nr:MAG: hypothetical protein QY325_04385 [Flavobacteriales bacterium]